MNARILVLFAHPALERSRVNRRLIAALSTLDGVEIRDLYELYPDFFIDIDAEQQALAAADVVILQHPFYWYSAPAVVKEWMDLVLEHGWAYGSEGHALEGKTWLSALTTGAREESYSQEGFNRFTIRQFLAPVEQTARLCGMRFLPPFVVHGTHRMGESDIESAAGDYRALVEALRDGSLDLDATPQDLPRLNDDLEALLGSTR